MKFKQQQAHMERHCTVFRRLGKTIAAAVLAGGIMLATSASAQVGTPVNGKLFAGSYDKTKTPSVSVGLSKGFGLPLGFSADASLALSSSGGTVSLESAELDLTTPSAGKLSGTAYAYNDRFYYVERGYGAMLNYGNFHAAGEYIGNRWGDAFTKYVVRLADGRVRLIPKAVILFSDKRVEGLGTELGGEWDVGTATLFGKVMHSRALPGGDWMNGNMQAGMSFSF